MRRVLKLWSQKLQYKLKWYQGIRTLKQRTINYWKDSPSERLITFGLERINQDSAVNLLEKLLSVFKIRELAQSITWSNNITCSHKTEFSGFCCLMALWGLNGHLLMPGEHQTFRPSRPIPMFAVVLLLDNAPGHFPAFERVNIKVVFSHQTLPALWYESYCITEEIFIS